MFFIPARGRKASKRHSHAKHGNENHGKSYRKNFFTKKITNLSGLKYIMDDSSSDPFSAYYLVNTAGTEKLARSAASSGVRRFIFMSTVKVNGEGRETPYTERDTPSPEDPYSVSKWEAEQALQRVAAETGLEA